MSIFTLLLANKHRILMMSPTSTTTYLKNIDDYFFRICATSDTYGASLARHLRTTKGLGKITLIYDLGNKAYIESKLLPRA